MRVSYEIFTVSKKLFELRRCSNNRKSNYRESTVVVSHTNLMFFLLQTKKVGTFGCPGSEVIIKSWYSSWKLFKKDCNFPTIPKL